MAESDLRGRRLGEFILHEELDRGAYGVVYRAEQPALGRDVVVKVLMRDVRDQDATRRFLREAQVASVLEHPYAAHVYAFGVDDVTAKPWIAMELVKGVTLAEWSKAHGPMPLDRLVPFFGCVAEVVQAAHEQGIVHRDLKPSNIMVIERGERLIPKLLDFGVAKWTQEGIEKRNAEIDAARADSCIEDSDGNPVTARAGTQGTQSNPQRRMISLRQLTRSGAGIGSLPYMSPEQYRDSSTASAASDIYALGVIVYELLTGGRPFIADTAEAYQRMHLEAVPPRLAGFPPRVDEIVHQALSKSPETRPRSALDMARQLREALQAALQAEPREQLRSLATVWNARQQPRSLLLRDDALHRMEFEAQTNTVGELERSFVAESRRDASRRAKRRRAFAISAAVAPLALLISVVWVDLSRKAELANETARHARQVAEVTIMQAELEQGRSALLHGEPDAAAHLAAAFRHDPSPSTAFMLARAVQPRLAERARLPSSSGRMWSAAFSPDGSQLVTTDDKNAEIWDAQTYRRRFTLPHGSEVYLAVYFADGKQLVTAAQDAIRIWDTSTGTMMRELRQKHSDSRLDFYTVGLSHDGKVIAALDVKGAVAFVWDAGSGTELAELRNDGSGFPVLAFSADDRWLATSGGSEARVFDTRTWAQVRAIPHVRRVAFSPTAPHLLTGGANGDVSLWQIPGGVRTRHLRELGEIIDAMAFSPDGQLVATASRDGVEQVWRAESGELRFQFNARHSKISALEFDRTSKRLLAAGADGVAVIADVALGMPVAILEGPQNEVRVAHFNPTSDRVLGASKDGTARVWDAAPNYYRWGTLPKSNNCGTVSSPETDRRVVAVRCKDQPTRVWDTLDGRLVAELPGVTPVVGDFTSAFPDVSAAGDRAAIARGNAVEIYELPSGKVLHTIEHGAPVNAVAFALTGGDVVSGAIDGSVIVLRENGTRIVFPTSAGGIDAVAVLPDGRVIVSDGQRRLRVYDRGGATLADLELPGRAMSLRISGTRLITVPIYPGGAAPPVLLDLERYRVVAQLAGHIDRVLSARWVAGDRILTAGGDGTARLWDGVTGELRQVYRGGARFQADAAVAPGGFIVAGGADGLLRFWDPVSARPLWSLQVDKSPLVGIRVEGNDIVTFGYSGELSRWTLPEPAQVIEAWGDHERGAIVQP